MNVGDRKYWFEEPVVVLSLPDRSGGVRVRLSNNSEATLYASILTNEPRKNRFLDDIVDAVKSTRGTIQ